MTPQWSQTFNQPSGATLTSSDEKPMHTRSLHLQQLPSRLQSLIDAELNSGEKITWIGMPNARRFAVRSLPILLFAIPWTAFALFWMATAADFKIPDFTKASGFFPLFGVPFVLVGLGLLSSPYWVMRQAQQTAYVITTARAIIFDGGYTTSIRSFSPDRLTDLRRRQRQDGSGDVIFERQVLRNHRTTDYGFFAIPDVKSIEGKVRELVDNAAKS